MLFHVDKSDLGEGYVPSVPALFGEPGGLRKAALESAQWEKTAMLSGNSANVKTDFDAVSGSRRRL